MAEPVQKASAAAWRDEEHVVANRLSYRKNFETVIKTVDADGSLGLKQPEGAFYFWFKTPVDEERFCFELFEKEHLHVLPGSYLSRETDGKIREQTEQEWLWLPLQRTAWKEQ